MSAINTSIFCRTVAVAVLATATIAAGTANATPSADAQRVVRFQDLNLSTSTGTASLYSRLQAASREVCAPLASRELVRVKQYNACYQKALGTAVHDVNLLSL